MKLFRQFGCWILIGLLLLSAYGPVSAAEEESAPVEQTQPDEQEISDSDNESSSEETIPEEESSKGSVTPEEESSKEPLEGETSEAEPTNSSPEEESHDIDLEGPGSEEESSEEKQDISSETEESVTDEETSEEETEQEESEAPKRLAASSMSVTIYRAGDAWYREASGNAPSGGGGTGIWVDKATGGFVQCGSQGVLPPENSKLGTGHYNIDVTFSAVEDTDANIRKVLWFGINGPAEWSGFKQYTNSQGMAVTPSQTSYYFSEGYKGPAYIATHTALSYYNTNNANKTGNKLLTSLTGYQEFVAFLKTKSASDVPSTFKAYVIRGTASTQDFYLWRYNPSGKVTLKKTSSVPDITKDNTLYSLNGTQYGIYKTKANATGDASRVATLTVNAAGTSNTVSLSPGTYWYREIKAGTGYALDVTPVSFTVTDDKTTTINASDKPLTASGKIPITKVENGTVITKGNAVFKVEYLITSANTGEQLDSAKAARTWYVKTINGVANLNDTSSYLAKYNGQTASALYKDSGGGPTLPLGRYRITEMEAPAGYTKTSKLVYGGVNVSNGKASFAWITNPAGDVSYSNASTKTGLKINNKKIIEETQLSVQKTVTGGMGNKNDSFAFTIEASFEGTPLSGTFETEDESGQTGQIRFAEGKAGFQLSHGEKLIIKKLKVGTTYTITEEETDYVVHAENETGTLTKEGGACTFVNEREVVVPTGLETRHTQWMWITSGSVALAVMYQLLRRKSLFKKG